MNLKTEQIKTKLMKLLMKCIKFHPSIEVCQRIKSNGEAMPQNQSKDDLLVHHSNKLTILKNTI